MNGQIRGLDSKGILDFTHEGWQAEDFKKMGSRQCGACAFFVFVYRFLVLVYEAGFAFHLAFQNTIDYNNCATPSKHRSFIPMVKRRIKIPSLDDDEIIDAQFEEIPQHRFLDIEAERARIQKHQAYEDFGYRIGVIIHWLTVKPVQVILFVLHTLYIIAVFLIKHARDIIFIGWVSFFIGGLTYTIALIAGKMP